MNNLKQSLIEYLNTFTIYDYLSYGWLIATFFTILMLATLIAKKKPTLSIFLVLFSFMILIAGPIGVKIFLDNTIRKSVIKTIDIKQLNFSDSLIIKGELQNISKIDFQKCTIKASVIKYSNNLLKDTLNNLKPLRDKSITIDKQIKRDDFLPFKIVINNFKYKKDFNVTLSANCF